MTNWHIDKDWQDVISAVFDAEKAKRLENFLQEQADQGKTIYPDKKDYFKALNLTPLSDVKVIILGQDPYHGEQQAHGLSFSVPYGVKTPPSLRNIFKEIKSDLGCEMPNHGNLEVWAKQGVLLLNTVLTVEASKAASHQNKGWEEVTDAIIRAVNTHCDACVFLLWGAHAQKKSSLIDLDKHLILEAPHPSPLSAHRGFLGCKHFSQTNDFLQRNGRKPINWMLKNHIAVGENLPLFESN